MKQLVLITAALLWLTGLCFGQGVKKFPGESCTLAWDFPTAQEANVTGFRIYQGLSNTGPFTFTNVTATKTARTVTLPATFPAGSVLYFYTARAYFTNSSNQTVESVDSNAVEVDLNVYSPTALTVK